MPKCGICGDDAPKQPCMTEEGKCDPRGRKVVLEEDKRGKRHLRTRLDTLSMIFRFSRKANWLFAVLYEAPVSHVAGLELPG